MEKSIKRRLKSLQKSAKNLVEKYQELRRDLPEEILLRVHEPLRKAYAFVDTSLETVQTNRICSPNYPIDRLSNALWEGYTLDGKQKMGISSVAATPPMGFRGGVPGRELRTSGSTASSKTIKGIRREAFERGQEIARAYKEEVEIRGRELKEDLAVQFSEVLASGLPEEERERYAPLLVRMLEASFLAWDALQKGALGPMTLFPDGVPTSQAIASPELRERWRTRFDPLPTVSPSSNLPADADSVRLLSALNSLQPEDEIEFRKSFTPYGFTLQDVEDFKKLLTLRRAQSGNVIPVEEIHGSEAAKEIREATGVSHLEIVKTPQPDGSIRVEVRNVPPKEERPVPSDSDPE